jgi:hypothetical protein
MFELCRDDHAIVVAAIARPDADQLISLNVDEGNAAFESLEDAEYADHVFAVLGACPGNSKKRSGQGASSSIRWTV